METRLTVSTPDRRSRRYPQSPVVKRSITLAGNKTPISLENQFWDGLREIARRENSAVCALIEQVDTDRTRHNLSSAVRLYVLNYFKARTSHQAFPNAPPELPANRTVAAS
jgi:predicted DNA-binding ribbon-helix-helix protein